MENSFYPNESQPPQHDDPWGDSDDEDNFNQLVVNYDHQVGEWDLQDRNEEEINDTQVDVRSGHTQGDEDDHYESYSDHLQPAGQGFNFSQVSLSPASSSAGDVSDRDRDSDFDRDDVVQLMSDSPHSILGASERWPTPPTPMAPKKKNKLKPVTASQIAEEVFLSSYGDDADDDGNRYSVTPITPQGRNPVIKRRRLDFSFIDDEEEKAKEVATTNLPPVAPPAASGSKPKSSLLSKGGLSSTAVVTTPLPAFAPNLAWDNLLKEHKSLLESKGKGKTSTSRNSQEGF